MRARSKQDYRTKSDFEIKHSLFDLKKIISLALATFVLCLGIYLIIPTVVGFADTIQLSLLSVNDTLMPLTSMVR